MFQQMIGGGKKVFHQLGSVHARLHRLAFIIGSRDTRQAATDRPGQATEPGFRHPPVDIGNIGIEAAVLMNDQHRRQFAGRAGRPVKVGP